jgi:hypothetical protein
MSSDTRPLVTRVIVRRWNPATTHFDIVEQRRVRTDCRLAHLVRVDAELTGARIDEGMQVELIDSTGQAVAWAMVNAA